MTPIIGSNGAIFAEDALGRKRALAGARARGYSEAGQGLAERISFSQHNVFNLDRGEWQRSPRALDFLDRSLP